MTSDELRNTNYEIRITKYELRITKKAVGYLFYPTAF